MQEREEEGRLNGNGKRLLTSRHVNTVKVRASVSDCEECKFDCEESYTHSQALDNGSVD